MTSARGSASLPADLAAALHARLTGAAPTPLPPDPAAPLSVPDDGGRGHPLSIAQQGIWFVDRLAGRTPAHTISAALRLRGPLDQAALRRAVRAVVTRHDVLRMMVVDSGDIPLLREMPAADVAVVERSACPPGADPAAWLADLAGRPFDLTTTGPLRVHLIGMGSGDHILLLLVHHLACDARSLEVLLTDLERAYQGEPLAPLPLGYADAAKLAEQRAAPGLDRAVAYWRGCLAEAPAVLDLDCARPRPAVRGYRGLVRTLPLSGDLVTAVSGLAVRHGGTLSSALLAAWVSVLRRHSGQDDIVVGTAVAMREAAGSQEVVGPLVNLVPLRVRADPIACAEDLLISARDALLGALDHAALPFERLVGALRPPRAPGRHPVFQVTFDVRHDSWHLTEFGGLHAEPVPLERAPARVDLALAIDKANGGWIARLVAAEDLFTRHDAGRLLADFGQALEAFAAVAAGSELASLTRARPALVPASSPPALLDSIDAWTARQPDALAVADGRQVLTYGDLAERSRAVGRRLTLLGLPADVPVGVFLDRSTDLVVGLLGVLRAGAAYLPLDPDHPPARTRALLADAGARFVLTRSDLAHRLPVGAARATLLDADDLVDASAATPVPASAPVAPRGLAYVIYTSGSTGLPKGVEITYASLSAFLHVMAELTGIGPADTLLALTTVTFDIAALELFLPLTSGGRVVLAPSNAGGDGDLLRRLIAGHGVTIVQGTPVTWRALLPGPRDEPAGDPAARGQILRMALCGGERLPADLARRIVAASRRAWNVYGPTETTIWSTAQPLGPGIKEPVPIGSPLPGTSAHVLDRKLRPVRPGDSGELCLGGFGVARGYRGRPGLTAERFVPDPSGGGRLYRTGDRVRLGADGTLEFLGRLDDQVKVRGQRVEPGEIEAAARSLPGVGDAVVIAPPGLDGERVLTCYVTAGEPVGAAGEDTPARLRLALRQLLPVSLVPDSIVVLDRLPLTPSGKVDRRALPAPDAARTSRSSVGGSPGPRDDVERAVADIWQEVLGWDAPSVGDDFFALGGHSLLAIKIAARLRDRFGVEVPLGRLLDQPTVAGMARTVADGERPRLPPLGTPAHDHADPAPLTAAQEQVWWVSQDPMASLAYHVHAVTPLAAQVSTQELAAAVAALTERHCVLRTTYPVTDGRPWLHVDDRWRSDVDEVRVPADAAVRDFLDSEIRRPFPLASAPPARWRVIRRPAGPALLMLTAHHISLDGWSVELLLRELAAMRDGADLPPAPCFSAVARWQRRALASAEVDAQRRYWRQRLGTSRGDAVLPSVSVPPSRPDFRGDVVRGTVPGAVRDLARRLDATMFTVLLAAFAVLLRGHSGNDDICVGVPMAARRLRELEDVVGMLANTVVLRCDLSGEPTFVEAVRRVRHAVFEAHSHQDVPFAQVVSDAGRRPGAGRNSFYQVLFGFDTAPHWHERAHNGTAKLDLSVLAAPGADGADIGISWEYATQALDQRTAEGMAAGYAALVADACENPERPISDLAPVKAAPQLAAAPPPVPRAGRRTATPAQGLIAAAFAEVLGVEGIGADDDFFALGGHSLMAARAIAAIAHRLGTPLPPRLLMEHPTIAGLAAAIERQAPLRLAPARRDGQLVLVTGGTGLVGGAVAAELRRRGLRVRVLARPASRDRARSVADEVAEGDLAEPDSLAEAATGVGAIVHAACTFTQPDVDVAAMARLAECAAGRPFVFLSSADVYGQPDTRPIAEDQPLPETVSAYAKAKADCERLLAASAGPGFALLRPPYVWAPGPYCAWQLRETAGAPVERAARSGAPLVLPPPGRGHAWVDARDLAWAAAECLASPPGSPLNVIGGHFDWRDLAAALIRLRGLDVRCVDGQPDGLYATHRRFDGSLAAARFGFAPRRDWAATLAAAFRAANAGTAEG